MKFIQVVDFITGHASVNYMCETVFRDEIEIDSPEEADPNGWWLDYCDYQRSNYDDALIRVRLYAEPYEMDEEPAYTFEVWESELNWPEEVCDEEDVEG